MPGTLLIENLVANGHLVAATSPSDDPERRAHPSDVRSSGAERAWWREARRAVGAATNWI
jgi:hypothetical protein